MPRKSGMTTLSFIVTEEQADEIRDFAKNGYKTVADYIRSLISNDMNIAGRKINLVVEYGGDRRGISILDSMRTSNFPKKLYSKYRHVEEDVRKILDDLEIQALPSITEQVCRLYPTEDNLVENLVTISLLNQLVMTIKPDQIPVLITIFRSGQHEPIPDVPQTLSKLALTIYERLKIQSKASPQWFERFVASFIEFLYLSKNSEAIDFHNKPSETYYDARLTVGAIRLSIYAIEFVTGKFSKQAIIDNQVFYKVGESCGRAISLIFDIFSYDLRVRKEGKTLNRIYVLEQEGYPFKEAAKAVFKEFDGYYQGLATVQRDLDLSDGSKYINKYIDKLKDLVSGTWHIQWTIEAFKTSTSPFEELRR